MECKKCRKINRPDSKFCRFCGNQLVDINKSDSGIPSEPDIFTLAKTKLLLLKERFSRKTIIITGIMFIISGTFVFAAPKIKDYTEVNKVIKKVEDLQLAGDYTNALASLAEVESKWTLQSKKVEITQLKAKQKQNIKDRESYDVALQKQKLGKLTEAREILKSIDSDFPKYEDVRNALTEIQGVIEGKLEAKAKAATVAKAEAERATQVETDARKEAEIQAQTEADARKQAEIRAQVEAQARVNAEAQARAAARAAQEAEQRRQAEEQRRIEANRISFLNQVSNIYNSIVGGVSHYSRAVGYYNTSDNLLAIAILGQASAVFSSTYDQASSVKSSYSNSSARYINAVDALISATSQYLQAVNSLSGLITNGTPSAGTANFYANNGSVYLKVVQQFLGSEGY